MTSKVTVTFQVEAPDWEAWLIVQRIFSSLSLPNKVRIERIDSKPAN